MQDTTYLIGGDQTFQNAIQSKGQKGVFEDTETIVETIASAVFVFWHRNS